MLSSRLWLQHRRWQAVAAAQTLRLRQRACPGRSNLQRNITEYLAVKLETDNVLASIVSRTLTMSSALLKSAGIARTLCFPDSTPCAICALRHSCSTSRSSASRRPTTHTHAPRSAYWRAMVRPTPLDAPRIRTRSPTLEIVNVREGFLEAR